MNPEEPNSPHEPVVEPLVHEVTQPEQPKIVGYCRACGKPLDAETVRNAQGTIYCEEHVPMPPTATHAPPIPATPPPSPYTSPYTSAAPPSAHDVSPGLAFVLGMIPGVGAIYNGQYAKGLVHVIIIGLTITIISNDAARGFEPLLGLLLAGFWFYMAFEAYHTARRRQQGLEVDEFSSLFPQHGHKFPVAPVLLIGLGVMFLLSNLDLLELDRVIRYWPVLLIVGGIYLLYVRIAGPSEKGDTR